MKTLLVLCAISLISLYALLNVPEPNKPDLNNLIDVTSLSLDVGPTTAAVRGRVKNRSQYDIPAIFVSIEFLSHDSTLVDVSRVAVWDIKAGHVHAFERVVPAKNITTVRITRVETRN